MSIKRWRAAAGLLVCAALFAGCGGGGDGAETPGGTGTPTVPDTGSVSPAPGTPVDDFRVTFSQAEVAWSVGPDDAGTPAVIRVSSTGTPKDNVYAGVTTPAGGLDSNLATPVATIDRAAGTAQLMLAPASALAAGTYSGTVHARVCRDEACTRHYPGSPHAINYTISVVDRLRTTPAALEFGGRSGESARADVVVAVAPGQTFSVLAGDPTVTIDQVTATGFRVTVPGRPGGTYESRIVITSAGQSVSLPIRHVVQPKALTLDHATVKLTSANGDGANASVKVTQLAEGATAFNAVVTSGKPWLHVASMSDREFVVRADGLPPGQFSGAIEVTSGADRRSVPVSMSVTTPPEDVRYFGVQPMALTMSAVEGGAAPVQQIQVTRASWNPAVGVEVLYPTTGGPAGWLSATLRADGTIDAIADAASLARGHYQASIQVTGPYPVREYNVFVSFTVGEGLAAPAPAVLTVGAETTATELSGSMPVTALGASSLTWTASSDVPWLRLTRQSGSAGEAVTYELDPTQVLTLPAYQDVVAHVTIEPRSSEPTGVPFTPVTGSVTLRRELPELHYIGPDVIESGKPTTVIVRGRGFDHVTDLARRLSLSGVTPTSVQRLSPTSLSVALPPLAAASRTMTMSSTLGPSTPPLTLNVQSARPRLPLAAPSAASTYLGPEGIFHDPRRNDLYVVNTELSSVQRFREGTSGWTTSTLPVPALLDAGMSPDGAWLVVAEKTGRIHLVDPATFTIKETLAGTGRLYDTAVVGHGLSVTNDGRVWLTLESPLSFDSKVTFDLRTKEFRSLGEPASVHLEREPSYDVSRNGERLLLVPNGRSTPSPPMLYMDASIGSFQTNPVGIEYFYRADGSLSATGDRLLVLDSLYDGNFARLGRTSLPDADWYPVGSVVSPDGLRVYVLGSRLTGMTDALRVYVFDADVAPGTVSNLAVLGHFTVDEFPVCWPVESWTECTRPSINVAFDGKTLFMAGKTKVVSAPIPSTLTRANAPTSRPMTLWRGPQANLR